MEEDAICEECGIKFTKRKNLYAHLRKLHDKDPLPPKTIQEICDICGQQFTNKSNFSRHRKLIHEAAATITTTTTTATTTNEENTRSSRIKCPLENCSEHFRNYADLRIHLASFHKVEIECNELEFVSPSEFHQWKDRIQERDLSHYVLHTSFKLLADGSKKEYYNCHRSYEYLPKGKGLRTSKGKGTNKTGKACPSRMEVLTKTSEGPVLVTFWMTHVGHSSDIGRVFLSKETRAGIAGKLKQGVTFNHILDEIRDAGVSKEESQRILLLERKDMHNIARDFHIDYGTKRHQNDAISISLWVADVRNLGDDCPVLLFKEQGVASDSGVFGLDDFVLIIVTSFQIQLLLQFGHNKICIDGTHGTNSYDFQLYTLMIVDEFGSGSPVSFCFSNRSDQAIFQVFFENVKMKVGNIQANVLMSDDAPAFYNAWSSVMSPVPNRLLCTWHVDRNWRHNLSKISGGVEKKAVVYKTLRALLQSTSIENFNESLPQVLAQLFADPDTATFGQYFKDHYVNRPQSWAYCYRLGLGINTNMYLESLHKVLKHVYLDGKKVRRLDKSVDAVMKIARDSLFKRVIKLAKNSPTDKMKRIRESHISSKNIRLEMIQRLDDANEFLVTSSTDKFQQYIVFKVDEDCSDTCLRCNECNICLHTFKCSCIDNVIKLNICKHIHACSTFFFKDSEDETVPVNTENNSAVDDMLLEVKRSHQVQQQSLNKDDIKRKAELVIDLRDKTSLTEEEHRSIVNNLDKIIETMNKNGKAVTFNTQQKININANVEKQVRLFSTKKRKTKEESSLKKPTIVEEKFIMDSLLNKPDINTIKNVHPRFDHT